LIDFVIPLKDIQPQIEVVDAAGDYDHRSLYRSFHITSYQRPIYKIQLHSSWKSFDADMFRSDLKASCLCSYDDDFNKWDVNMLVEHDNDVLTRLLDIHAPVIEVTCRLRYGSDPWYDADCHAAKGKTRNLDRRYKRWKSDYARNC